IVLLFFFSSRRRHTRFSRDWSSDVCSSDLCRSRDHESRPEEGRFQFRRPDHLLRLHAGLRPGHGPHPRLPSSCATGRCVGNVGSIDAGTLAPLFFSRERSVDTFKGALIVGFLRLFALLPWSMVQRMGALIGWLMWKLPNRSREVARTNLSHCFPELRGDPLDQLLRHSLQQIGKTLTESA